MSRLNAPQAGSGVRVVDVVLKLDCSMDKRILDGGSGVASQDTADAVDAVDAVDAAR